MDWKKKLEDMSLAEITAVGAIFTYITGYLISSLYVRSRGINQMSLIEAQYIETGLVFILLTALFVLFPITAVRLSISQEVLSSYKQKEMR